MSVSSLSDIIRIGQSGLAAAQAHVSATSDNIANVNTVGYTRKVVTQSESVVAGRGVGVSIDAITRASNAFLQRASLQASAQSGQATVISTFIDHAQQLFGDPSTANSFFAGLDNVYSAFSAAADTPTSNLGRTAALSSINDFLTSAKSISTNLSTLRDEANKRAAADTSQINDLLSQISQTNADISRITAQGGDASGSQNQQGGILAQLNQLMQVQMSGNGTGGVVLRSQDGVYLAGDQGAATLNFSTVGGAGLLTATPPKGQPMQISAASGEIAGLMHLAGVDLPQLSAQLGEFVTQAVDQINAAQSNATAFPPPNALTGVATGVALPTAINGFSGKTTVAITDASGSIQQKVDITFGFGSGHMDVTDNTGAMSTINFNSSNFLSSLNTALGSQGYATYTNGVLKIAANSGADGVAVAENAATPTSNGSSSFAQFFGLNNLIQSSAYAQPTGILNAASPNTFSGQFSLQIADAGGAALRQVNLTIPAGATTVGDVINALNANIGAYGQFGMNPQGHLAFAPNNAYTGSSVAVISDNTVNAVGGPNITALLGIGWSTAAARASSYAIRSDIAADPSKLALGQFDPTQAINGPSAISPGDGRGAAAIAASGGVATTFSAAGAMKALTISVSGYAAELAGQIGQAATNADNRAKSATALATQTESQRSAAEGVNLDTELVNLTTYQQSYNACARLVQASKDMYDVLLQML
jgi:flagellar hook-associated protein 1 FlgK